MLGKEKAFSYLNVFYIIKHAHPSGGNQSGGITSVTVGEGVLALQPAARKPPFLARSFYIPVE